MAGDQVSAMDRRRELLRQRLTQSGVTEQAAPSVPRILAGTRRPLSAGQRRMWFVQTKDPADAALNIGVAHQLRGLLDETRLREAFDGVLARHDILRTTYRVGSDGEPYQEFSDQVELPWKTVDLRSVAEDVRDAEIERLARGEFGLAFDLAIDVPLRVTLIRTEEAAWVVLLVVHHICWDDNSWEVFFADLNGQYNSGQAPGVPPQFMVVGLDGEPSSDTGLDFWCDALTPLPEPLELPGTGVRSPSRAAEQRQRPLSHGVAARVEEFARTQSATPFMVFLAAFGVLIRRYTSASDFLVAIPVTERKAAAENAIGYFGNTLLLRAPIDPADTFASYVATVREVCLNAFGHQDVGIDRVVREVNPYRAVGRDGLDELVRLGFSLRRDSSGYGLTGIEATQLELGAVSAQLPLSLAIVADTAGTAVEFEYQTDMLPQWLVDQLLGHFEGLLDIALADPHRRVAMLDPIGAPERRAIMRQSRGVLSAEPAATIVAVLETAGDHAPDAIALISDDVKLSYRELHQRANRLARWLIGQGIGTEDIVALRMTTSVEFIVAMLAVLKSGAGYFPIDPGLPEERIEFLLADARPQMVLGPAECGAAELECAGFTGTNLTDSERLRPLLPGNLAYVIYTSGSTGRPKGVAVAHAAIAEHVVSFTAEWDMTPQDRMLQSTSVSFDASLADILCPLSLGAGLVIPRPNPFSDIGYLADLVQRHGVTVVHMVPSLLGSVLLTAEADQLRGLRHVPVGGEALPGEVADKFATMFDGTLRNHYGPTEAVVCSTHMSVVGPQGNSVVPIGRPNRNVSAYVLDETLSLAPTGVVGELYLGGAQLARGYLSRPALSAQRFVADPFSVGGRLYRTGDLVRRNASGELEFIGRADEQVKVRGYRIELGEIEAAISADPRVCHCVVIVAEDAQVGPMLAAYVVPATVDGAAAEVDLDGLRSRVKEELPAYMVPSTFTVIPGIPLTSSGKLDKRSLPKPDPLVDRLLREPSTPTERRMCAIFAQLFGRDRVGVDDSFFELGGHSLLAARLTAKIRAQFGIDLTVRVIFDSPTPAALAECLVAHFWSEFEIKLDELELDDSLEEVDIAPRDGRPELVRFDRPNRIPLSYSQSAMWFEYQMEGAGNFVNMPFVLQIDGPLDTVALAAAINDVVARQEALRVRFGVDEGMPYQWVEPSVELSLPTVSIQPGELDDTLNRLRYHAFDLQNEPPILPTLLTLGAQRHVLCLLLDHIIADHTSLGVILTDLIEAYRARLGGGAPGWEPILVGYLDYVLWHRQAFAAGSEFGETEMAHWREHLAGVPDQISVAHDRARPQILGKQSEMHEFVMSAERRAALVKLAERSAVTEFMVYQAALAVVLHRLGGGNDIVMGSPIACRTHPAASNLVGLFANMVALRNDFSDDPTLRTVLSRSRETIVNAQAHQELPFERLVEAINPRRSRSWNAVFQTMISFRGADWSLLDSDLTGSGETSVHSVQMGGRVSYVDLNVGLIVNPDGGMDVSLVANADLYDAATTRQIAHAFEAICDSLATNQDQAVSAISILPDDVMERLLAPPAPPAESSGQQIPAGSPETMRALIEILEELLEITDVQADDNFFALGGDSVISIQWSARAVERGLALTPQMVFEHMTISELAGAVDWVTANPPDEVEARPEEAEVDSAPMSASGLDADALASLAASWQAQS
ncbi:non-ribosomal peptide synthetase [Mycobacteroides salmoniphilum]|uniref:non-ribosomal peptide synthetase n=1 Tax=Mycobacteroides salmoniphilum TaxID=404941 RepID=UPI000991F6BA|nr:non-ribosomal peptide synthetase [Mycobacteroides salmoniphilum]QCH23577.1 Dimodular nonribosomal peptide synthase [Mycobacteroides salmoniphilum]